MLKSKYIFSLLFVVVSIAFLSCDKDKKMSKRLFKGTSWEVTTLTVDGVSDSLLPVLKFKVCDIYADSCVGEWQLSYSRWNNFYWQFNDKAQTFSISRQYANDTADFLLDIVKWQCYQYSGKYNVLQSKKKEMIFESTETIGYTGKTVKMILQKVE